MWMYVVHCADDSLYCGIARDVDARIRTHNSGKGSKYVRSRLPVTLHSAWEFPSTGAALRAERAFKRLTRAQKEAFLKSHPSER